MTDWQVIPGFTEYKTTLRMMENHIEKMMIQKASELVLLTEHLDVYTAGTGYKVEELIHDNGIPIVYTGRGGKFTYHGPGQRVIYPMLNLGLPNREKDLKKYVKNLEKWIIFTLNTLNLDAFIVDDRIGVWVLDRGVEKKIAAIGIRVRKWITYHGMAINISTDLQKFGGIVPCGIKECGVTSIRDMGCNVSMSKFDSILQEAFEEFF
jgi:lipoyl(octanoyl) transferase